MNQIIRFASQSEKLRGYITTSFCAHGDGGYCALPYAEPFNPRLKLHADQPHLGRARDDIRKGYRVHHVRRHLIFYRQKSTGIEITRILHDRMDLETHLRRR